RRRPVAAGEEGQAARRQRRAAHQGRPQGGRRDRGRGAGPRAAPRREDRGDQLGVTVVHLVVTGSVTSAARLDLRTNQRRRATVFAERAAAASPMRSWMWCEATSV